MTTFQRQWPRTSLQGSTLVLIALSVGCAMALGGLPSLFVLIGVSALVITGAAVSSAPAPMLSAGIWLLGLCPYSWGLQTGVAPKLFGDEILLLLCLLVAPVLYVFRRRQWQSGHNYFIIVMVLFMAAESLSLVQMAHDLVALRNLLETFILGPILAILFVQEAANTDTETIAEAVVWLTAILALLSLVERVTKRNPILEHAQDITYMSPQLVALTNGVYRPYVSFFHPSETGTFMAMGFPFAVRMVGRGRRLLSMTLLMTISAGLLVNATRGVWVGVAVASLMMVPNILTLMVVLVPLAAFGGGMGYFVLKDTAFMHRLTDGNDLYSRFESWSLALKVFQDHLLTGVGHMQFKEVYLNYVQDLSNKAHFDISKIYVADNMYLTTLVEHGVIGTVALLGMLLFVISTLRRRRARAMVNGNAAAATLLHASELAVVVYAVTGCFADVNLFTKATKLCFILIGLGLASSTAKQNEAMAMQDAVASLR